MFVFATDPGHLFLEPLALPLRGLGPGRDMALLPEKLRNEPGHAHPFRDPTGHSLARFTRFGLLRPALEAKLDRFLRQPRDPRGRTPLALRQLAHNDQSVIIEPVIRAWPAPTVAATSLRFMRVESTPSFPTSAVHEDLDLLVPRELPSQIVVEVLTVPRRDYEVSNHGGFPLPDLGCLGSTHPKGLA
jgi:hypothetical protein